MDYSFNSNAYLGGLPGTSFQEFGHDGVGYSLRSTEPVRVSIISMEKWYSGKSLHGGPTYSALYHLRDEAWSERLAHSYRKRTSDLNEDPMKHIGPSDNGTLRTPREIRKGIKHNSKDGLHKTLHDFLDIITGEIVRRIKTEL